MAKRPTRGAAAKDQLAAYRAKRDFERTPEPSGAKRRRAKGKAKGGLSFVVQKHAATRLHYDFRLELDGVLKSWAVTRGPSPNPKERRLAVHVEDHPLDYGDFEGVIPEGYGAGAVMLWDRGTWEPVGDARAGYEAGKLKFALHGKRLRGGWNLVRMGGRAGSERRDNWLLIKERDDEVEEVEGEAWLARRASSVVSRRSMDAIAADRDRVWQSNREESEKATKPAPRSRRKPARAAEAAGARRSEAPRFVAPQLATLVDKAPEGDRWLHEIKFDGYRLICRVEKGRAALLTRTGLDWTDRFRWIAEAAAAIPARSALIDGEAVVLDERGVSDFQALQNALSGERPAAIVFFAFDLLHLEGRDLTRRPLVERKAALRDLLAGIDPAGPVRSSDHQEGHGGGMMAEACRLGLEGVVSKRTDAPYRSGRSGDWLKTKCVGRQEFVIGGFTRRSDGSPGVGALLLGAHRDGGLVFCGKVGTGLTHRQSVDLRRRLDALPRKASPFGRLSTADRKGAIWVKPALVCEVAFIGWTADGHLRHPSFKGLREDKPAEAVMLERTPASRSKSAGAKPAKARGGGAPRTGRTDDMVAGVRLSHPGKVLYSEMGLTKADLAAYYVSVADLALPHVAGRPLSLVRCPAGRGSKCFFQKHAGEGRPEALRALPIRETEGGMADYLMIDDVRGLVSLVQMGVLEMHPWGCRADDVEKPDRLILDFDPDEALPWARVLEAALRARDLLADCKLESFVKTTGGKGLHVVVPVARRQGWDELKSFAQALAETMAAEHPGDYVTTIAKRARTGRILIDYLRNGRGATAVAPYSTRARVGAPIAWPLDWAEIPALPAGNAVTVTNVRQRLAERPADPWAALPGLRQSITQAAWKRVDAAKRATGKRRLPAAPGARAA